MKKIQLVLIAALCINSCDKRDEVVSDETAKEDFIEMSQPEDLGQLREMALEFKSTAEGLNGFTVDKVTREKLLNLSNMMMDDFILFEKFEKFGKVESPSAKGKYCIFRLGCRERYNSCIWWAKSWDDLLRRCNSGYNMPNNCDQIRKDYIKNIDEIEQTYIKCNAEFRKCQSEFCPKDPTKPL